MKFSVAFLAFVAPMVLALPNAEVSTEAEQAGQPQPQGAGIHSLGLSKLVPGEDKRSVLEARLSGKITSCGSVWVYKDGKIWNGNSYYGFDSAIDQFCQWTTTWGPGASPAIVPPGEKLSARITGWALMSHGLKAANIDFEIHNKQGKAYTVDLNTCKQALLMLSQPGNSCYGSNNKDTKGGTWQMPGDTVTFHAINSQA